MAVKVSKWNTGQYEGDPAVPPGSQIDFPVDPEIIDFNGPRPKKGKVSGSGPGDEPPKIPGDPKAYIDTGAPTILNNLNFPVGTVDDNGNVDVVIICSEIKGSVKYEARIARSN